MNKIMSLEEFVLFMPSVHLDKGAEYPFVPMEALTPGYRYVHPSSAKVYEGGGTKFGSGDTLFARITPCLENGKIAQYRGSASASGFGSTEYFVFRARPGISDPSYVFYLASSDIIRKPAEKSMSGASGRQRATWSSIKDLKISVPPLATQRKIAAILSAYDDLIENNTRRIAILESMAQMLYREWFVHFRFPGHATYKMIDSPLGPIPEGWSIKKLADFGRVVTGRTPSTACPEYYGPGTPFVKIPDMTGHVFCISTQQSLSDAGVASQMAKTIPANSICVSCIGSAGVVSITVAPSQTNQQINSIVLDTSTLREFLYFAAVGLKETINLHGANGATMVNLNKGKFESLEVISPDEATLNAFHHHACPLFEQIKDLLYTNANLRRTRDLLLPKLISGEVDVADVTIETKEREGATA